jgi:hypothetical protein
MLTRPCPAGDSIWLGESACVSFSLSAALVPVKTAQIQNIGRTAQRRLVSVFIRNARLRSGVLGSALVHAPFYRFKIFVNTVALTNVLREARLVGLIAIADNGEPYRHAC